jgi:hypothetical protein
VQSLVPLHDFGPAARVAPVPNGFRRLMYVLLHHLATWPGSHISGGELTGTVGLESPQYKPELVSTVQSFLQ